MTQLERDLERRISDRLHLWIKDSVELFEMAGLSEQRGLQAVVAQLVYSLIGACLAFDIPEDTLAHLISEGIKRKRAKLGL